MRRKKPAGVIVAFVITMVLIMGSGAGPLACSSEPRPTLVTRDCTDPTATSLTARGEVESVGAGPLSRRGFVLQEGDSGDPPEIVPLVNPSFERGTGRPTGWIEQAGAVPTRSDDSVFGDYSTEIERKHDSDHRVLRTDPYETAVASEGETFTARGVCKRVRGEGGGGLRIEFYDSDGNRLDAVSGDVHSGTGWGVVTVTATAPAGTANVQLQLRMSKQYDVFRFDGVLFVKGSELPAVFEEGEFGPGTYSLAMTGLEPGTLYQVRAFGENEAGIGYGNTVACSTPTG